MTPFVEQPLAQLIYAQLLERGARLGLVLLVLSFAAYVLGWLAPLVPLEELPQLWSLPLADYLQRSATPTGWGWLRIAHKADMGGLVGIALLAGCSLPPLAAVLVHARRHGDRVTVALCAAQILVVLAAASGVLTAGH
jgi:hypothetical protein